MASDEEERLTTEIELLESMYPEYIEYSRKGRELSYTVDRAGLKLRVPYDYLQSGLPDVVSASIGKQDVRDQIKKIVSECSTGEEVLDSIIASFNDLVESAADDFHAAQAPSTANTDTTNDAKATIIVWLHHLLNSNKRKQCLAPPNGVSGVTKPGYPGVLIYSGPLKAVHDQVNDLKQLNWAAFQIRLESEEEWHFQHGAGVVEVEAMKDLVAEVGEAKKEVFLEAMRMK
ncbi:hypothetical protein CLAFUW4_09346 [Fulvia fulva]|uniref:RWD domain-containing protein n=1 Tax=Passalora fulva TaxID=5499 RepID=A0A9Q8PGG6_PASFU|nr:uncharacterized protein CLAFUR5_09446 [Fulvia fulva]KAK4614045.1 hypothetical protein CLAFUR4_09352 [Fulvia fulva]KAK4614362.1 hypothetical protein CLAFUR0_09344 [Fulvia fulva]UJO21967.1 hypothetical protein CLAFUR5_09446 [Fulvia fulva]WPV19937.1 hypothetical protein CLAFUW4_09346 [Fulvia fulva]WPV35298.1 hypothetical protein CLAFUW7_09347 [Fulvia fulva]